MKTLLRARAFLFLPAGILLAVVALTLAGTKNDDTDYEHVTITDDQIIIPLKAMVSKDVCDAMNKILQQYDKSLYKIDMYNDKGVASNSIGALSDLCIDAEMRAHLTEDAKEGGHSDCTMQVGAKGVGPETGVSVGPERCKIDRAKAKELIMKLKPILEKYTKK